jgi:FMN-dependent NADH-azoreductase
MKILHIDSSALGENSVSRHLSAQIVAQLKSIKPDAAVTARDVAASPLDHLSGEILAAGFIDAAQWNDYQKAQKATGEEVIGEFLAADVIVVGAPMYNLSIPSQLKAWIDRICVAGRTFRYTEAGPQGLAGGKKVIIASSRGGQYGTASAYDFQEDYLKTLFAFLGITDITVIRAEGVNMGEEVKKAALAAAKSEIGAL